MKLCADVGLGPGYIVLDGDPASPPKMAHSPPPIRGPCLLCQIAGWIKMPLGKEVGLDQPRRHCVRWGPSSPPKRATEKPPTLFGPCILWPNGWITMPCSMEVSLGLGAGYIVLDGEHQKKGTAPNFRPVSVVDKQLDGSRCHFMQVDLGPGDIVLDVDPAPQRGRSTHFLPIFLYFRLMTTVAKRSPILATCLPSFILTNSTQVNEHLWTQVLKHLNVHIYLDTI